jgi:FkbM family methyltransferase
MFSDPEKVIVQSHVAEGMTIADFGSGIGFYAIALAKRVGHEGKVYAIDILPDHLRKLKNDANKLGLNNIEVIQGDLEAKNGSGLLKATVDRVIISNMVFQAERPQAVIAEARRILKHDGKVAVVDWSDSFGQIGPHKDHIVTKEAMHAIFEREGFSHETNIDAGSHHYGMLYTLKGTPRR